MWSTCQCTCRPAWFTYQRACACKRGLRANVPKACQHVILTCQRANKHANVPNDVPIFQLGVAKSVPKSVPIYQTFLLRKGKEKFYALLYKIFYIILDIIVIHMICTCIVHKNCSILHFYTPCHIKESVWNCSFLLFFSFLLFS